MLRDVIAAVAGIIVAIATVMLLEYVGHAVYPPPADLDIKDTQAMIDYVATLPPGALLFVLAAYVIGTFDGVFVAVWIGRTKPFAFALVIGVLMLVATITNLIMIPHPMWFSIAAVVGIVAAAWLATLVAPSKPPIGSGTA